MKRTLLLRFLFMAALAMLGSCAIQTKEVFTINPDLSGKCIIEAKIYADTSMVGALLSVKDSAYGITPPVPNFHKQRFSRKDAMVFALNFIKARGVEVWNNIHFGMSKKRDMIFFSGVAYFRNIEHVRFSMIDSALHVVKGNGGQVTFKFEPNPSKGNGLTITDDEADKKVTALRKNAFYARPVLADVLNPTVATVIYNLPGKITSSTIIGQQGDDIAELTLTGNEIMRYADSLAKNQQLALEHFKYTHGTNAGILEPLFNRIVWGIAEPAQVTFVKQSKDLFNYNSEVQSAMLFYADFMQKSKLDKFDSTMMMKEEKTEQRRPKEYGVLMVSKVDSAAKKPYVKDMFAIQSHDTIIFTGEFSEDIKAEPEAKVHITRLIAGTDQDITDSIVDHTKIKGQLSSQAGDVGKKTPKRKVTFMFVVHWPKSCSEISVQGRLAIMEGDKPGTPLSFKMKQIAIISAKRPQ